MAERSTGRLRHRRRQSQADPRRIAGEEFSHLSPVSGRPPFREYVTQLVERRHFVTMQAWSQSTHQHRGTFLGNAWLILAPVLDALIYFLIFGILLQVSRGMENFFGYLVIGVFMFTYTTRCVNSAAGVIHNNRGMIRAFAFPRAALPLASVLREMFGTLPVLLALAVMLVAVPPHADLTVYWLIVPVVFMLQTSFNLGVALLVARLAAVLPDLRQVIPYIVRLWFYGSAVMFAVERFDTVPWIGAAVRINPMYVFLTVYRELLLEGTMPDAATWGALTVWALGVAIVGMLFFWRGEVSYGRTT